MRSAHVASTKGSAPENRGQPVNIGRANRRAIRQAAQLAEELNLHIPSAWSWTLELDSVSDVALGIPTS